MALLVSYQFLSFAVLSFLIMVVPATTTTDVDYAQERDLQITLSSCAFNGAVGIITCPIALLQGIFCFLVQMIGITLGFCEAILPPST